MSLTAIQNYVQGLIQGTVGAYDNVPLQAWVDPPTGTASAETPQAYILNAEGEGLRQTMAYTSGFYEDVHQVFVYVEWMFPPGVQNANFAFTNLVDTIINKVRTSYTGAIFITDPVTFQESQLLVIGDKLRWRYLPQHNIGEGGQEWLDYVAQITFEVKEKVQYVPSSPGPVVTL
jgi:hypothetical protein